MHPAPSVIIFSVLSGAGFGYLAFLGLGISTGTGMTAFWQFGLGIALAVVGLISSTFHLGNPKRALLAFTQWRTSWLSREAWIAVAALLTMGVFAAAAVFLERLVPIVGVLGAALSLGTVFVTSMIYAQMATVPRWNSPLTPAYFLASSVSAGAILSGHIALALTAILLLGIIQLACWWWGDQSFAGRGHSVSSATGLGRGGQVRLFESPHSGTNYLLKEFVFQVARRRADKLRAICIVFFILLPALIILADAGVLAIGLAFGAHLVGAFISRWLFFAQAEHVVQLYYGHQPTLGSGLADGPGQERAAVGSAMGAGS